MAENLIETASTMILPLWLMFIVILQKMSPYIINVFLKLSNNATQEEQKLVSEIIACKKDLSQMSMTSDYVKYVKCERQIIKLEQNLKPLVECRKQTEGYAKSSLSMAMYILLGILFAATMYVTYAEPVVKNLHDEWFYPINYLIGLPTGLNTVIGVPFFMLMFRTFINALSEYK